MEPTYQPVNYEHSPEKKQEYWQTAFGLQAVDGIEPSPYLRQLAAEHIRGEKTYEQLKAELSSYYDKTPSDDEADKVSQKIYEILSDQAFSFDLSTYKNYHKRLFSGINDEVFHPGEFRTLNITKKEPILGGDTMQYQDYGLLEDSLNYDFTEEKAQDYTKMSDAERISRLAEFTSRIWQVHPFMEGNTRTTAVFLEKYLRSLGYQVENEPFEQHSLYFRNALVRANYNNIPRGISATPVYCEKFLRNLLLGEKNVLDNRELVI